MIYALLVLLIVALIEFLVVSELAYAFVFREVLKHTSLSDNSLPKRKAGICLAYIQKSIFLVSIFINYLLCRHGLFQLILW